MQTGRRLWKIPSLALRACGGSLLFSLALLAGCDWPGKPRPEDRPVPAEQVEDFDRLYSTHCAGCHGADGKNGPAPPLNDSLFLAIIPDKELRRVIARGREGTPMTAFAQDRGGPLTDKQVDVLARDVKLRWEPAQKPKAAPPPYLLSEARRGDARRGRKVFARDCATCHGNQGQGGEEAGAINDPAFLALVSDQALRRIIITGRPDLDMPNYADRGDAELTSPEINDLVALLASWRAGSSQNER